MANFEPALQKTLANEGGFFHNPVTGEIVNRGITLTFVQDCGYCTTADEAYIQNLTMDQTAEIYRKYFWDAHKFGEINDQDLASKVFDLTVNMGPGNAAHEGALTLLQSAICDCGGNCQIDGIVGPQSIAQVNALNAAQLLAAYRQRARLRYQAIAAGDPKVAPNLNGWLRRLDS
jgi:lysozyme family protein